MPWRLLQRNALLFAEKKLSKEKVSTLCVETFLYSIKRFKKLFALFNIKLADTCTEA